MTDQTEQTNRRRGTRVEEVEVESRADGGELEERKCEIGSKSVGKRSSSRTSPQMF